MTRILVTGGAGYIGSHTVIEVADAGFDVTILDNLCNSSEVAVERVKSLTKNPDRITFVKGDILDKAQLDSIFAEKEYFGVIHFAALKAVGESVQKPLEYFEANTVGLLNVLNAMRKHGVKNFVFSSSATVYGSMEPPFYETTPVGVGITNPYGRSKFMAEGILEDCASAYAGMHIILLRYFNPVGAHASGLIGEDPKGVPNNLMPYIQRVAVGSLPKLTIYGNDYPTVDGTGERDYIHVVDLAKGHMKALERIARLQAEKQAAASAAAAAAGGAAPAAPGVCEVFNLGTGNKTTVLQLLHAFEKASGKEVPYAMGARRAGDVASSWADASKAEKELGWKAEKGVDEMCRDSWKWVQNNPDGYRTPAAAAAGAGK